ncbi:MAG: hypothetical protein V1701_07045 [Planctomycetota bacterium]
MPCKKNRIGLVQVKADGRVIPIKGFIQEMIGSGIIGMLKPLKGVPANPKKVEIKIKILYPK